MSFSLPLACRLTASPLAFQTRPKSTVPLSRSINPKLTTNKTPTFSPPQCKPPLFSSSATKSFVRFATSPADSAAATATEQLSEEQYKAERDIIIEKIDVLEINIHALLKKNTNAAAAPTGPSSESAVLEGVLKDSFLLGLQVKELEGKSPNTTQAFTATELFESILNQFQGVLASERGLVPVNPNPTPGPTAQAIDLMVREIAAIYYTEDEPPFVDKFTDNYAPIREETTNLGPLPVLIGQLPAAVNGMYLRVGPDPKYDPVANYQWLDGDGMVHGVRIQDGQASYTSHYVKNSRFLQENAFEKATMFKYGDLIGVYGIFVTFIQLLRQRVNVSDMSFGYTTSNVGVVYHAGRFMALEDFGKPHVVTIGDDGTMVTAGMNDYNGQLNHNFTPHPKKDAVTGEMFTIALSHTAPYAHYTVYSPDGGIRTDVPLTVSGPTYMHDLAITENYAVIMDNPYTFNPEVMMTKDKWIFSFDASKKSRFGILPRYATDEQDIKWFEIDNPSFIFHTAYDARTGDFDIHPAAFRRFSNITTRDGTDDPLNLTFPELYKFTFNMTTGEATKEKVLDVIKVDNPKINENYMGRKTRYAYSQMFDENVGKPQGIIKHDLQFGGGKPIRVKVGEEYAFLSEHAFVPKENPASEDDGYLVFFAHVENQNNTHFIVLNATNMEEIVGSVLIPKRIPYGLHAIFVNEQYDPKIDKWYKKYLVLRFSSDRKIHCATRWNSKIK